MNNAPNKKDFDLLTRMFPFSAENFKKLPVSFELDGKKYSGFPDNWLFSDATVTSPDGGLQFSVEMLAYPDFPVVEWLIHLKNTGNANSPQIKNLRPFDFDVELENPVLHRNNGDFYSDTGLETILVPLENGVPVIMSPTGGRACDRAFPYMRVLGSSGGFNLAVGWPAQWEAGFTGSKTGLSMYAGQQETDFYLKPGEQVMLPRITIMTFEGDAVRAANLWRRWFRRHILITENGAPLGPKVVSHVQTRGEEWTMETEETLLEGYNALLSNDIRPDIYWVDAGWYKCGGKWWAGVGQWTADTERFPNGLAPVGKKCAENGARFLLWFEPERVYKGTWLYENRRQWLLSKQEADGKESDNYLLNLADPECLSALTDHISGKIAEYGVTLYRQDFNFEPLGYWQQNDGENRRGILENLHTQGYLKYWDALRKRHPGLIIDSCASGGRRNDLETMRRSIPLHHTDYGYGEHPVKQAFYTTMHQWLSYFRGFMVSWDDANGDYSPDFAHGDFTAYDLHNAMAAAISFVLPGGCTEEQIKLAVSLREKVWRRAAHYILTGDLYMLTPYHKDPSALNARQFDENGAGFIHAISGVKSAPQKYVLHPQLDPAAQYEFENAETGETWRISGTDAQSLELSLGRRDAVLYLYKTVG